MLELRQLEDHDLPLVDTWLEKEHVKRWYEVPALGVSLDDWRHEIRERNGEYRWITYFIAVWDGVSMGFCQYYRCEDSLEEDFGELPVEGSYGIDYMIGEEAYLRRGLGRAIIALLAERIFSLPGAQRVTADLDPTNKASSNALRSACFLPVNAERSRYVLERA